MFDHNFDFLEEDDIRTKGSTDMTSTYIDPELDVIALVDIYDEESGSELSEYGKQVVTEKLQALGYTHVTFIPSHEMAQYVNAGNGKWVQPDSAPVAGWAYYDAPDGEMLVDDAGIDFTDPKMWEAAANDKEDYPMTNTMEDIRIESHERREGGLRSIQPGMHDAAENLREILRDMEALVRVSNGNGSAADFERLGIEPDADPVDAVSEWVNSWALDVQASDSRVMFLHSTGGPYIELDILTIPNSESYVDAVEEVILRRSWPPARDRAWTTDERALGIVAYFLDLIGH